jgi:hypothetical protein
MFGYEVRPGKKDMLDTDKHLVYYLLNQSVESRLAGLCHELGHIVSLDNMSSRQQTATLKAQEASYWGLEWEFQAWAVADDIVKALGHYNSRYIKLKTVCLRRYYERED